MKTRQCKWNQDFHSTKSIEHKLLYEHQTNETNFWKHLKVCMLWRDKALIKCSTALSTGVFIKEWHLKSVTCNDERNVRFCTKNYIFIKAHFRNTPSTCSTKFNLCSELCLYRIQKEEKKKLLTRIISINLHIFSTELYTFSSNGLPHLNLDVQVFCVYGIRFQSLKKTYVHHYYRRLQKRKDKMPFKISFY